jgi:hypothetical protein
MAQIIIDFPDAQAVRVRDAVAAAYGYTGLTPGGQVESKAAFVKRMLAQHVKGLVKQYETEQARLVAAASVIDVDVQ